MPEPSQFNIDRTYPGRWTITFSNPPINMFLPTTIVELGAQHKVAPKAQHLWPFSRLGYVEMAWSSRLFSRDSMLATSTSNSRTSFGRQG